MKLDKIDGLIIIINSLIYLILIIWELVLEHSIIVLGLLFLVNSIFLIYLRKFKISSYYQIKDLENIYTQLQDFYSITNYLEIKKPLPSMRGYAASPDFIKNLLRIIEKYNPNTIVELGSGTSSIVTGYLLKSISNGKLISMENDNKYFQISKENIDYHGLTEVVKVKYTPLKTYNINNQNWKWYDISEIEIPNEIDMIVVDGPPSTVNNYARFPALHILRPYLSNNVIIVLDDADRKDEKEIVRLWLNELPNYNHKYLNTEKGMSVLIPEK